MKASQWTRIEDLFHQAASLDQKDQPGFLDHACGGDQELRREVESLLAADAPEGELLQAAVWQAVDQLPPGPDEDLDPIGQRFGPYSITSLIGKGGMGAVYLAAREDDFHMRVAIKLLKRGTDTDLALSRFRTERQILAGLQHPNIATLLDGDATETGRPYFAMEYVDGIPLLEYAAPLTVRECVKLFRTVCSAVQYAHRKLVVHRDIKPANILVTADGIPKLLDFGIAKLVDTETSASTTTLGLRMLTPDYASPEQVRGGPVTAATDVYSLGAVLYELLTGQRPHQIEDYSPAAIEEKVCIHEPRRPSAVAQHLDPDLDKIVMRALRKEPAKRYASVEQFSDDLGRYLRDLPVQARKGDLLYRGGKFLKRHRASAITAAALSAVLGVAMVAEIGRRESQVSSIAVLPFSDMSPEKDQEYFCDGLTEELRNRLAKTPGLLVAGRTSSSQFRAKTGDYRAIGANLHVGAVMEGSVRKQGGRVRITAELIKAADGFHLWSETFDREINDIFAVQDEIARGDRGAEGETAGREVFSIGGEQER